MPPAPQDSASQRKRIAALTGYLIALLIAAASIGLYRVDAEDYREEAQALLRLKRFNEFLEANPPESLRIPLHQAARAELGRRDPDLDRARLDAQQRLVNHLILGLGDHPPTGCEFFEAQVVEGKFPSLGHTPTIEFSFVTIRSPFLDPPPRATELAERGTVSYLLTRLDEFFLPVEIDAVRQIDLAAVPDPCANRAPEPQAILDPATWRPPFRRALLEAGKVSVEFAGTFPFQPQAQMQLAETVELVDFPVEIGAAELTSTAELFGAEHKALVRDLGPLWEQTQTRERLDRDYGFLPIDYAVSTAGASLVQGYAGATIIGVKLAPRRVALIVTVVGLLLVCLIARECQDAHRKGTLLQEPEPDGPRAQIMNSSVGRVAVWVLTPPAAILLASPFTPPWLGAAALATTIGCAAVYWARRPYARDQV